MWDIKNYDESYLNQGNHSFHLNHVGYKEIKNEKIRTIQQTSFIWTMWDIKKTAIIAGVGSGLAFHLNHVGYKAAPPSGAVIVIYRFHLNHVGYKGTIMCVSSLNLSLTFIWTMWDIKNYDESYLNQYSNFHLNHVGYKVRRLSLYL